MKQVAFAEDAVEASIKRVILIPVSFAVDGKGLTYFLKSNGIPFEREQVKVIDPERPDVRPLEMQEYFFPSQRAYEDAESVWYNLTGCNDLGKINDWQKWGQFK